MKKEKQHSGVQQLIVSDVVVCGASYHTRAALSYDMRPHKQRDLIQLAVPHMSVVFLLSHPLVPHGIPPKQMHLVTVISLALLVLSLSNKILIHLEFHPN